MFDTIKMQVKSVLIPAERLYRLQPRIHTYLDEETGMQRRIYHLHDEQVPYIRYQDWNRKLTVQVSIPKFLFGNNITLLKESDCPLFFTRLQNRLSALLDRAQCITRSTNFSS